MLLLRVKVNYNLIIIRSLSGFGFKNSWTGQVPLSTEREDISYEIYRFTENLELRLI